MRYCIQADETGAEVTPLFTVPEFRQRLLRFDGGGDEHRDDERDEVLYVLEGSGVARVGGEELALEPGTGVFVARGTPWQVGSANGLKLLSVLVEEPLPASASHAVIASGDRGTATAGREFTLLAHPENGCESVTQFRGYIPPVSGCLARVWVRLVHWGLILLQPIPILGALMLPLMCWSTYAVYRRALVSSARKGLQPAAAAA